MTLFDAPGAVQRRAVLSPDGLYRYVLTRMWHEGPNRARIATFVMLNPSTADATEDDPTIRRCIGFARGWGCDGLTVVNLYAYRATDPRALWTVADPVGAGNDHALTQVAEVAAQTGAPLVAAWGANARPDRVAAVLALPGMGRLSALGTTKAGQPRHPLYLPASTPLTPWAADTVPYQPARKIR